MRRVVSVAAGAALGIALVIVVVGEPLYVVDHDELVVITRFGDPVGEAVTPGLKAKVPFLDKANVIDARIRGWDGAATEMATTDRRFIFVGACAQWRVADPVLYVRNVRDELGAMARLDEILDGEIRRVVAAHPLIEVVRSTDRDFVLSSSSADDLPEVTTGRAALEREVLESASDAIRALGIEIVDFRFKSIGFNEPDLAKIYEDMIAERLRMAERIRADGDAEAARIARSGRPR